MKVKCPECGGEIRSEDMNLETMAAKCRACNDLFELPTRAGPGTGKRPIVSLPYRFRVSETDDRLEITYRWFNGSYIALAFFCVIWDGFLAVWYTAGVGMLMHGQGGVAVFFLVFPILHVLVGVLLTYSTIAGFFNRTVITVSHEGLVVWHGPLPWGGHVRHDALDIDQIYCESVERRNRNSTTYSYSLNAMTKHGTKLCLTKNLDEKDQAVFLEQQIEKFLAIKDRPVSGEIGR